jgi:carbonic anhydrase
MIVEKNENKRNISSVFALPKSYFLQAGSCSIDDITFTITDHSILATYDATTCEVPRMIIPGQSTPYEVLQFHLHTGTDHAVDGLYFGSCMHLVHKQVGGDGLSVLGFFLEPTEPEGLGQFSELLSEWEKIPVNTEAICNVDLGGDTNSTTEQQGGGRRAAEQGERRLPISFNPYDLIPDGSTMYTYEGSLTTPPCSEIVFWNVIDTPVSISVREFLRLTNLILDWVDPATCEKASEAAESGFTGRPVQQINGREITRICPKGFVEDVVGGGEPMSLNEDDDSSALLRNSAMAAATAAVMVALI